MAEYRSRRRQPRTNPLAILFLGVLTALFVFMVLTIVLGFKLRSTRKALATAQTQVEELSEENKILTEQAKQKAQNPPPTIDRPSVTQGEGQDAASGAETGSGESGAEAGSDAQNAGTSGWLDLSSITGVDAKPEQLLDKYYTYYATATVNLRSGPGTNYKRIGSVDQGAKVDVAAREGNWMFLRAGERYGWIKADFLSTTQPTLVSTQTKVETTSGNLQH